MIEAAGISSALLPPVRQAHHTAGTLRPAPAAALGLPAGIPVAMGAGDDVECLGAGLLVAGFLIRDYQLAGAVLL